MAPVRPIGHAAEAQLTRTRTRVCTPARPLPPAAKSGGGVYTSSPTTRPSIKSTRFSLNRAQVGGAALVFRGGR